MHFELDHILVALSGGLFPVLLWLWFWLREDRAHPEPKRLIALAFIAGMVAVAVSVPAEQYVAHYLTGKYQIFTVWSIMEELLKFIFAYATVLRLADDDEPIDPVIYMITVALGFAGAENVLFMLSPLSGVTVYQTVITGNFRFIGATLLHTLTSATIGVSMGLAFYSSLRTRIFALIIGIILACSLHAAFNFFILSSSEKDLLWTFSVVWVALLLLLATLEYLKRLKPKKR